MILRILVRSLQRRFQSFFRHSQSSRQSVPKRPIVSVARQPLQLKTTLQGRAALLLRASVCIRLNDLDLAQRILSGTGLVEADPARLNLLGIIWELRKQSRLAWKFYGRAIRSDSTYEPPRQNLRRLYELNTFGATREAVNLGDEDPRLWAQRAHFLRRLETDKQLRLEVVHHHDN